VLSLPKRDLNGNTFYSQEMKSKGWLYHSTRLTIHASKSGAPIAVIYKI